MAGFASDLPLNTESDSEDLFPADDADQKRIVSWVQRKFILAEMARQPQEDRWLNYYKGYRSFISAKKPGMWRSQVWMPISFYVIETILPRLAASLPSAKVEPVGPGDTLPAATMEEVIHWAEDVSELYIEQVKAVKSSLIYGTGILKVGLGQKKGYNIKTEPVMQQTTMSVATGQTDLNGDPMMQEVPGKPQPVVDPATGQPQTTTTREEYLLYEGPIAEAVDIENFFPDPMCSDVDDARFVIHRVYRDAQHIKEKIADGTYKVPDPQDWRRFLDNRATSAVLTRLSEIERGSQQTEEGSDKDLFPLLEFWTKQFVITVAGERGEGILLRAERNPYAHGEIPFIRVVDHIVPHEFWGIGELEPLEGIQDVLNAIWNSRIDNVKLALNKMFAVVEDAMVNPNDLVLRPGGVIRLREGLPIQQVFQELQLGDVTQSAYTEAAEIEREGEKVTGVSPYQTGQDSPAYNRTATGVALISEQGNTRFSFKVTLAEHTGYKRLARMYASVLQQFCPADLIVKLESSAAQSLLDAKLQQAAMQGMPVPQKDPMSGQYMMQAGPAQPGAVDPATGQPAAPAMMPIPPEQMMQAFGVDPTNGWAQVSQDGITGRFRFDIEAESSAQTLSTRREQTLSLAQTAMADPYFKPRKIREDLLKEFGRKNVDEYLYSDIEIQMMQQQQAMAAAQQQQQSQNSGPPSKG